MQKNCKKQIFFKKTKKLRAAQTNQEQNAAFVRDVISDKSGIKFNGWLSRIYTIALPKKGGGIENR